MRSQWESLRSELELGERAGSAAILEKRKEISGSGHGIGDGEWEWDWVRWDGGAGPAGFALQLPIYSRHASRRLYSATVARREPLEQTSGTCAGNI